MERTWRGWRNVGEESWEVVDGAILGQGVTEKYGYLATIKSYRDFHLALRFKCEADGNSGVYIHTAFEGDTPRVVAGRQIEIDRTLGRHTGGIYGDGKGWIAWPSPQYESVIRPYDWNGHAHRGRGESLRRPLERYPCAGLHLPCACRGGRRDRSAATLRRRGQDALQGYLRTRSQQSLTPLGEPRHSPYTRMSWTISPCTSVNRMSRPL